MRNAAVVALTKNAADELGKSGINVTGVSPGLVRTEATSRVLGERAQALFDPVELVDRPGRVVSRAHPGRFHPGRR